MNRWFIIDLEATCWESMVTPEGVLQSVDTMEIIEVGCAFATESGELLDTHSFIVRPTENPELSPFCMSLTSIAQDMVDAAQPLSMMAKEVDDYVAHFNNLLCVH